MVVTNANIVERSRRLPRFLLFSLFVVLMIDNFPGMGLGIAPGLSAKNLYLYMLVLMLAFQVGSRPMGIRFVDMDIHWPFILLIAYSFLTWVVSSIFEPSYSSVRGAATLKNQLVDHYLLIIVFLYSINSRREFLWILRAVVVTMFLSSFITLIDFMNIPDLGIVDTYKGRLEGPFGAANEYGALLAFLLPVSVALMPEKRSAARYLWIFGIFITGVLLVATGSRGAYLATVLGCLAAVFYLRRYLDMRVVARYSVIATAGLFMILVVFTALNPELLLERFEKTTTGSIEQMSSGRVEIWTATFLVMAESPISFIFGYGWNSYATSGIWKAAHNEYLNKLFELGVVGVILFVAVLRAIPARVRRAMATVDKELSRILIGYVFGMAIILVDIVFVAIPKPWAVVWIISALVCGLSKTTLTDDSGSGSSQSKA